jgi:hypothetical protein
MNTTAALIIPAVRNPNRLTIQAVPITRSMCRIWDGRSGLTGAEVREVHAQWVRLMRRPEREWRAATKNWCAAAAYPANERALERLRFILFMERDLEGTPSWIRDAYKEVESALCHAIAMRTS